MIDPAALLPLIAPSATVVLVLIGSTVRPGHVGSLWLTVIGLLAGVATLPFTPEGVGRLVIIDAHALFYSGIVLAAAAAVAVMAWSWLEGRDADGMLALIGVAALGGCVLAAAVHLATLVLGIELLSVSLYGAIAYTRDRAGVAAGARYLVLAAGTSAVMLYGAALLYAETGSLGLGGGVGALLILVAIAFKLALPPFHLWALDVYQGAPAPVTALIATVSKAGVLAVLVRWSRAVGEAWWFLVAIGVMAGAAMLVGNLLALRERSVKRLLAGSSIAHMGYAALAVVAGSESAAAGYIGAYVVTALAAFGVVSALSRRDLEADDLSAYRGLLWRAPVLGGVMTAAMLSLAGIPLTAGFVGKVLVLLAGVGDGWWVLVALLVVGSALGIVYYLRVVAAMFQAGEGREARRVAWAPVVVAAVLVLVVGVWPMALLGLLGA